MDQDNLNHLRKLEAESIHILRETWAEFKNPVLLYSIGKDSSVLLRLAKKAFAPAKIPFAILHVNTGFKFREMIEFRDQTMREHGLNCIEYINQEPEAQKFGAESAHTDEYIYYKKTKALLDAIKLNNFDAAIGGSRRDEEKVRAKERIFSIRQEGSRWDPKNQRPELWHLYNGRLSPGETMRVFPLSNWTEIDIWNYIRLEKINIVPLYFAENRKVMKRNNIFVRVDEFNVPHDGEEIIEMECRYRTLGCSPSTGVVSSSAKSVDEIINELISVRTSERQTRAIDATSASAMEQKKKEGYF